MRWLGDYSDLLFADKQARPKGMPLWTNGKNGKEFRAVMGKKPIGGIFSMGLEGSYRWKDSVQIDEELRLWVADGVAQGMTVWFTKFHGKLYDRRWMDTVKDLYNRYAAWEPYLRNTGNLARTALVYSQETGKYYGAENAREKVEAYILGAYQLLTEARIPFEMVHASYLEDPSQLSAFRYFKECFMKQDMLPVFPYGAVYYRKTNPPRAEWERDYSVAREDGMNIFRHWFMWNAIEQAPGVFEWEDYDKQLDLAAKNGMKTIIAEMSTIVPEWAYRKFAHARFAKADGTRIGSHMQVSCAIGGIPGLCWDNDDYRAAAENFITQMVKHYKGHPGLGGYDIWNECNYGESVCYCEATQQKFRQWLEKKYGSPKAVSEAWKRYGFASWDDVVPPLETAPYPDTLDWLQFKMDTAYGYMHRRAELIRSIDPDCAIVAHGIASSLTLMANRGADDWRAASEVEIYGMTWGSSRHGDEPWRQFQAIDLVRASSRGKPYWHAESYAGPLWLQPQVVGKPRNEGRIPSPEDARYWNFVSYMGGATGIMYLRWRPLLDGDLFGAFGPYAPDGSRTDRSAAVSSSAKWITAPERQHMLSSRPVKGEIGILYVPESQLFTYSLRRTIEPYAKAVQGVYQGFFDRNIQADLVHVDDIKDWDVLYLPYPVMLSEKTAAALKAWVAAGGKLIAEGCPAYFGDSGHVSMKQPGYGLDELFGAAESYVEFTPDLLQDLSLTVAGDRIWGGEYLQTYKPAAGTTVGWYEDGRIAAVDNQYGKGRTRLIGTMAGYGYATHGGEEGNYKGPNLSGGSFFEALLEFAGIKKRLNVSDSRVSARLHDGKGGTYLWLANPKRQPIPVQVGVNYAAFSSAVSVLGPAAEWKDGTLTVTVPSRDVIIYELK
jgi:beta-galactosidase